MAAIHAKLKLVEAISLVIVCLIPSLKLYSGIEIQTLAKSKFMAF
jgi:hypothetical protein